MVKVKPAILVLLAGTIILLLVLILAVKTSISNDQHEQTKMLNKAVALGINKAKSECIEEGIAKNTCETITGNAVLNECSGQGCWIVHTMTPEKPIFRADVTVGLKDNKYIVTGYLRDPNANGVE